MIEPHRGGVSSVLEPVTSERSVLLTGVNRVTHFLTCAEPYLENKDGPGALRVAVKKE